MRNALIAFGILVVIALIAWSQQPVNINNTPNVNIQNNAAVNVAQMNGVATSMGNGTTDTGTQRVTLSSDSTGQVKATNFPTTVDTNTGAAGASTVRVAVANTDPCGPGNAKSYAFYDASTNGATQLVALASSKIIYVCSYSFSSSSTTANTLKLVYGTGSNCATGQTAMTPGIILQAATSQGPIGKVNPNSAGLATIASNALCVLTNAAAAAQAEVSYVQQ